MSTTAFSQDQISVFQDRYALRDLKGSVLEEFPDQSWKRVAIGVAEAEHSQSDKEKWASIFYELLSDFRYVPGGRISAAMGSGSSVTAQNCYVIPSPEDSREGIMKSLSEWVEIQSRGGGVGINISSLRPRGATVRGVNGTSSGPVNWAQMFAFSSSEIIIQGGSRRGAAMIMINDDHPDVVEFIHAKESAGKLEGCNMSVCLSNAFMAAVESDSDWELKWKGETFIRDGKPLVYKARDIWRQICEAAWKSAEPGIYFMERANDQANSGYFEELISTNPCGEQPLGPYGACLLGAFNLKAFVKNGEFNWTEFKHYIPNAVRFNDNIIDLSYYPLPECEESQKNIRRMGIGIMGLADSLIELGMRYGSAEAVEFTSKVFHTLRDEAYMASSLLAADRGSFPKYTAEYLERPFIKDLPHEIRSLISEFGIRNCYLLTQAPTGTTSIVAGVNSGIEPYFDFRYIRNDRMGTRWILAPYASEYYSESGTGTRLEKTPFELVTANDVTPAEHIAMQAAAQRYIDSSISKTANLPESATVEDVEEIYLAAWKSDLKSLSIYRDHSRDVQALDRGSAEEKKEEIEKLPTSSRRRLPNDRSAITHKFNVGEQEGYLTVGLFPDGSPGELFINVSKQGSTVNGLLDVMGMLVSFCLQGGVPLSTLVDKISGVTFDSGMTSNPEIPIATSIPDYIVRWMNSKFGGEDKVYVPAPISVTEGKITGEGCPRCGSMLRRTEGCAICPSCTYEKCG